MQKEHRLSRSETRERDGRFQRRCPADRSWRWYNFRCWTSNFSPESLISPKNFLYTSSKRRWIYKYATYVWYHFVESSRIESISYWFVLSIVFCVLCVVSWVVCCALPVCILCVLYRIVSTYVDTFCDLETDVCHARLCQTHRLWNCKKAGPGLARLSADHATGFRHENWCSLRKSAFLAPYAWGWSDFHLYRQSSLHGSRGGTTWVTLPNFAKKTCKLPPGDPKPSWRLWNRSHTHGHPQMPSAFDRVYHHDTPGHFPIFQPFVF